jgi:hypothetical protein
MPAKASIVNKTLSRSIFLLLSFLVLGHSTKAQSDMTQTVESKIEAWLQSIDRLGRENLDKRKQDSLRLVNAELMAYLKKVCTRQPGTLQDEVRPIDSNGNPLPGMNVLTSDDNKLRIYCWDTHTGQYQNHYDAIAQVAAKGGATHVLVLNDIAGGDANGDRAGRLYSDICMVHTLLGKPYYLVMDHRMYHGKGGGHAIHAYTIDKGSLIPAAIFKTNGKLQHTMTVEHDMAPYGEWAEDDANIKLSDDRKTMYVPLLKKDSPATARRDSASRATDANTDEEKGTPGYYIYRFNGFHYMYDKEANKSLDE